VAKSSRVRPQWHDANLVCLLSHCARAKRHLGPPGPHVPVRGRRLAAVGGIHPPRAQPADGTTRPGRRRSGRSHPNNPTTTTRLICPGEAPTTAAVERCSRRIYAQVRPCRRYGLKSTSMGTDFISHAWRDRRRGARRRFSALPVEGCRAGRLAGGGSADFVGRRAASQVLAAMRQAGVLARTCRPWRDGRPAGEDHPTPGLAGGLPLLPGVVLDPARIQTIS